MDTLRPWVFVGFWILCSPILASEPVAFLGVAKFDSFSRVWFQVAPAEGTEIAGLPEKLPENLPDAPTQDARLVTQKTSAPLVSNRLAEIQTTDTEAGRRGILMENPKKSPTGSRPRINDITTDEQKPPQFVSLAKLNPSRNYRYPAEFAEKQRDFYVDLKPLQVDATDDVVFQKVLDLAKAQKDWEIVAVDPRDRRLEAVATTRILRFKDDIVIEVRGKGPCEVHMRSKSRLGLDDLGANAKRIQSFFSELTGSKN